MTARRSRWKGRERGFTFAGSAPGLVDDEHDGQPAVDAKHTKTFLLRTKTERRALK